MCDQYIGIDLHKAFFQVFGDGDGRAVVGRALPTHRGTHGGTPPRVVRRAARWRSKPVRRPGTWPTTLRRRSATCGSSTR
jgi:hypothetical protein